LGDSHAASLKQRLRLIAQIFQVWKQRSLSVCAKGGSTSVHKGAVVTSSETLREKWLLS
jgi:hypothetical protein